MKIDDLILETQILELTKILYEYSENVILTERQNNTVKSWADKLNMTYDELFYHSKIVKNDERFYKLKKKILNYYIKLLLNFLILNFKKVTFYYEKILAFNKFKAIR